MQKKKKIDTLAFASSSPPQLSDLHCIAFILFVVFEPWSVVFFYFKTCVDFSLFLYTADLSFFAAVVCVGKAFLIDLLVDCVLTVLSGLSLSISLDTFFAYKIYFCLKDYIFIHSVVIWLSGCDLFLASSPTSAPAPASSFIVHLLVHVLEEGGHVNLANQWADGDLLAELAAAENVAEGASKVAAKEAVDAWRGGVKSKFS